MSKLPYSMQTRPSSTRSHACLKTVTAQSQHRHGHSHSTVTAQSQSVHQVPRLPATGGRGNEETQNPKTGITSGCKHLDYQPARAFK